MDASITSIVVSGGFGAAAGVLSGFLGIGGGAILTPALVFALGVGQTRAQGISLAALLPPVGLPAVIAYRRRGVVIDVGLVVLLIAGFLGGGVLGARLAHRVPSRELTWAFACFLLVSAWRSFKSASSEAAPTARAAPLSPRRRLLGLPIGLVAGTLSGLLGIGGGLATLPMLRRIGVGRLEAQAVTLAMMLPPIGLPAVYVYAREEGGLPWPLLVAVGVSFAGGAGLGAVLAAKVPPAQAARFFSVFLAVMAVMLVLKA